MALNGNRLGDAILAALDALNPDAGAIPVAVQAQRRDAMRAIGGAIVAEVQTNAAVTVAATVAAGIAVAVTPGTGLGATTAPGTATTSAGTVQ